MKIILRQKKIISPRTKEPFLIWQMKTARGGWKTINQMVAQELIDDGAVTEGELKNDKLL